MLIQETLSSHFLLKCKDLAKPLQATSRKPVCSCISSLSHPCLYPRSPCKAPTDINRGNNTSQGTSAATSLRNSTALFSTTFHCLQLITPIPANPKELEFLYEVLPASCMLLVMIILNRTNPVFTVFSPSLQANEKYSMLATLISTIYVVEY